MVIGTHGRKGVDRFFMGSFAEELLMHAPGQTEKKSSGATIPMIVIGPHPKACETLIDHVLFATDFSEKAFPVFEKAVGFASRLGARMTVLHAMPRTIEPVVQSGVYLLAGGWVPFPVYYENELSRLKTLADSWSKRVSGHKIQMDFEFDPDTGSVQHSILSQAEKKGCRMIMMAAQSGRVASALLGSVTRGVVRSAQGPVWVLRSS